MAPPVCLQGTEDLRREGLDGTPQRLEPNPLDGGGLLVGTNGSVAVQEGDGMKTTLITGCGSGIGLATALELARRGHKVFATMLDPRETPELGAIAERERLPIEIRELDVRSDASVHACFEGIREPIDVLVNNAGVPGRPGSIEELPIQIFSSVMETNYLGAVRCMKAVLPRMRQAKAGRIVNVSSVTFRIPCSPLGAYVASKFALEAISEALAGEVKALNIRVAIVEPGIRNTRLAWSATEPIPSLYPQGLRWARFFRAALAAPVGPEATATLIRSIIESDTWQLRHPCGPDAAALIAWRSTLSDEQWIDWSAQDDDSWYRQVKSDFGMDLRPEEPGA